MDGSQEVRHRYCSLDAANCSQYWSASRPPTNSSMLSRVSCASSFTQICFSYRRRLANPSTVTYRIVNANKIEKSGTFRLFGLSHVPTFFLSRQFRFASSSEKVEPQAHALLAEGRSLFSGRAQALRYPLWLHTPCNISGRAQALRCSLYYKTVGKFSGRAQALR